MASQLEVRDLHPGFASEVIGLDVHGDIDADTATFLQDLFDARGLLLVRDPDLGLEFQTLLSNLLIGENVPAPAASEADSAPGAGDVLRAPYFVSNKEPGGGAPFGRLLYHSDGMWQPRPFQLLSLFAVHVEPPVTPTSFVSTTHAWATLPEALRNRVESLHVEHGHDATYERGEGDGDVLVATFDEEETNVTAIGHTHPRTGAKMLYASQMMTKRVVELPPDGSEALLADLFAHLYTPDNTFAHEWRDGDLVLWDNLALQHGRPNVTVEGPVRTLRKVFAPAPIITAKTHKPHQRTRATA
jgi:alpha-ketoglutarate-dependent taurine dioxygenase